MGIPFSRPNVLGLRVMVACLLLGGMALADPPPEKAKLAAAPLPRLVEAFMKGPISMAARVVRAQGQPEEASLPLFQVPVLKFKDLLEISFAGEAFDQRVTTADWSLIVVFLPRTIAPTEQGVVNLRLKAKGGRMVVPAIPVPYDSIPMLFLIPDKSGRKKVLKDLNAHLESFRTLCAKIADLSAERATVDQFIEDLDAIDKTMSPAQYDNAVAGFFHSYGTTVSADAQAFTSASSSNLDKCQFLTQEFQKTNVLVPDPGGNPAAPAQAAVTVTGGRPVSAYVSIFFDVATIISNLWPGHQFQYLPALARNFHGCDADLYYTDWIHTTGDTLGALMCCPGKWEDQQPPEFDLELPWGESLFNKHAILKTRPKVKGRNPFALYGHDWKLLVTGPKGEGLPPLSLAASPNKDAFVAEPAALAEPLRKLGSAKVKARIVGRWGFTSIGTAPLEIPVGLEPVWAPSAAEQENFQLGKACSFALPAAWAGIVEKVLFRPAAAGTEPQAAKLVESAGKRLAVFTPKEDMAGEGTLEIFTFGNPKAALTRKLTLQDVAPEAAGVEARIGEPAVILLGHHLKNVKGLLLGKRRFVPVGKVPGRKGALLLKAEDGKPFEGAVGNSLEVTLITQAGKVALDKTVLLAARPRLGDPQVTPMAVKGTGFPVTSTVPVAPTRAPSQVSLFAVKGYRFPVDGAFHALIRNADEPAESRVIPGNRIRVMGNSQKATFAVIPADLLGGRASGKLEVQLLDDHAGASDWLALPATFLDLPVVVAVQEAAPGVRLLGPSLDPIEAAAPAVEGPWEKLNVQVEEGHETITLSLAPVRNTCYLRVFGWPDLVLALHLPAIPFPPKPSVPATPTSKPPVPEAQPAPKAQPAAPAAATEPLPATAKQPLPAPATEPLPAPAKQPLPAPATEPLPAPATEPLPAPAKQPLPAPATEPLPAPATEPPPAPAKQPLPAAPKPADPGPSGPAKNN